MRGRTSTFSFALLSLLHALENEGSYQALDLGSLGDSLAVLGGDWATDNVLADIIVLGQVEQATDLAGTLGPKTTGDGVVSKTRNILLTFLDNSQVEYAELSIDNASTD